MQIFYMKKSSLKLWGIGVAMVVILAIIAGIFYKSPRATLAEPIYQGDSSKKQVAIVINVDWGEDIVPKMVEVLAEKDAKATFFITGRFAEKYPDIVRQIATSGQEIENHGYAHPHPDKLSVEDNATEIRKTEEILQNITGEKTKFFAAPYGEHSKNVLQAVSDNDYQLIMWTLDTIDWRDSELDVIIERASGEKVVNGAIILMHPKEHTLEALPQIIDNLRTKGYTLVGIAELVAL